MEISNVKDDLFPAKPFLVPQKMPPASLCVLISHRRKKGKKKLVIFERLFHLGK